MNEENESIKGVSYRYSAVVDSMMDVLAAFYTSLPGDLNFTDETIKGPHEMYLSTYIRHNKTERRLFED